MKAAVASGILLCLLLVLITVNGIGINRTVTALADMVAALPDEPSEAAAAQIISLRVYLEKKETFLSFSVPFTLLDRSVELGKVLEAQAVDGSLYDYVTTKVSLADAIQDMGRLERIHWKNIF